MGKKKVIPPTQAAEGSVGVTVEQHLKDLGLLGVSAEEQAAIDKAMSPLSEQELKALDAFLALDPEPELFTVDLYDAVPVVINGAMTQLPKGKQEVTKQIYNVLKDANLI